MKKILFILITLISVDALASDFCNGFELGYKTGYKKLHNTGFDPFVPFCPFQPFKSFSDPSSDFEHGYIIGFQKGMGS